jgi:O-antigen ligase
MVEAYNPGRIATAGAARERAEWLAGRAFRPLHALFSEPEVLFLAALIAMLFRPPDLRFYGADRILLGLVLFVVWLRALALRQPLPVYGSLTWPLFGLLLLALTNLLSQPYQTANWSVFVAKWVAPFAMYHAASLVFQDEQSVRRFEIFSLLVLAYLTVTAILFLTGPKALILPPFILDQGLGIHADRARGPFLEAMANGMTLTLLGLIALDRFRRHRLGGMSALLLVIGLPLAVLATKTRAVWLSFAAAVAVLLLFSPSRRVRRACLCLAVAGAAALLSALAFAGLDRSLSSRLEERSPVEFRFAVYHAGWEMFCEKPWFGWGAQQMQPQLERRISDFHEDTFYLHNTYLEIGAEHGLAGLALYLWLAIGLFRLSQTRSTTAVSRDNEFLDRQFRSLWPVLVGVYLLNACFVVMNYQFVNSLLFTLAGMLEAQNLWGRKHSYAVPD